MKRLKYKLSGTNAEVAEKAVFSTSLGKNKLHILNDRDLIDKPEIAKLYMKVMTLIFE